MSFSRRMWIALGLALLFQADLLCGVFRMGEDLLTIHYPQQQAAAEGEIFFSPRFGLGLDLMAEGQTGVLNPINILLRLLPLVWGFALATILLQALAFLGTGLWLSTLGRGREAQLLGMLVYGGSLCLLLRVEHWPNFQAACWLPLVLWGRARGDYRGLAVAALGLGCALSAGAPQFALWMVVAWFLDAWLHDRLAWGRSAAFVGLGTLLAAWPLWAMAELTFAGERAGGLVSIQHSLPWRHLVGWALPFPMGHPVRGAYLGGGPVWEFALYAGVLSLVMFWRAAPIKHRALALVLMALMLGEHCPLTAWLYSLPPLSFFRVPPRCGFVLILFMAAGVARALELGPTPWRPGRRFEQVALFLGAMVGGALLVAHRQGVWPILVDKLMARCETLWQSALAASSHSEAYFHHAFEIVLWELGLQLVAAGAVIAVGHRFWRLGHRRGVIVVVAVELLLASYFVRTTVDEGRLAAKQFDLPDEVKGLAWIDPAECERDRVVQGEQGHDWQDRVVAAHPFVPELMAGGRLRDPLHHSPLRPLHEKQWQRLLRDHPNNDRLLRRADMRLRRIDGQWSSPGSYAGALFYPGSFMETALSLDERLLSTHPASSLQMESSALEAVPFSVPASTERGTHRVELGGQRVAGWLRFNLTWHPGWVAHVDGASAEIARVDLIRTAIRVPAGAKQVTLSLEPGVPWGPAGLMALAWGVLALLGLARPPGRMDV